jgi:hypothetical protein
MQTTELLTPTEIVKNYGNYFIDEIEKTGKIIYEKTS